MPPDQELCGIGIMLAQVWSRVHAYVCASPSLCSLSLSSCMRAGVYVCVCIYILVTMSLWLCTLTCWRINVTDANKERVVLACTIHMISVSVTELLTIHMIAVSDTELLL